MLDPLVIEEYNVCLAMIAINMTILGLTALAESKVVIGIKYGEFLVKKFKVLGRIRIYYLLMFFAGVNAVSLVVMLIEHKPTRSINIAIVIASMMFAIYYFFGYILIENKRVKQQIYQSVLLGLYYDSEQEVDFEADKVTHMQTGSRSNQRMPTAIITYFNNYDSDSQEAFETSFGPQSIIYDRSNKMKKYWKKNLQRTPYDYCAYNKFNHISHEYFQLFRYTELQDKWTLEIIRMFNQEYAKEHREMQLDNMIRIISHINIFGKCPDLFKYKFVENISPHVIELCLCNNAIDEKEAYFLHCVVDYCRICQEQYYTEPCFRECRKLLGKCIFNKQESTVVTTEKIRKLLKRVGATTNEAMQQLVTDLFNDYIELRIENGITIEEARTIMKSKKPENERKAILIGELFS